MPCKVCRSDFNLFNWKFKCGECSDKYCKKCLTSLDGIMYCERCSILLKRPPDRTKLMELRSKDLQEYLQKHNIPTRGLVEKRELVDLLCTKPIPVRQRKGTEKLTANFAGSVPNLGTSAINDFIGNIESTIFTSTEHRFTGPSANDAPPTVNSQASYPREAPQRPPPPFPPGRQPPPYHRSQPHFSSAPHSTTPSPQSPPSRPPPPGFNIPGFTQSTPATPQERSPPEATPQTPQPSTSENTTGECSSSQTQDAPSAPPTDESSDRTAYPQATTFSEGASANPSPTSSPNLSRYLKLSDIDNIEDLSTLSSKQLKVLLTMNRVDFKGCIEKTELLERAQRLWHDSNRYRKEELPEDLEELCKLCMDAPLDCVLLECGHIATCINCGKKLAECPICRQYVSRVVRTFKA